MVDIFRTNTQRYVDDIQTEVDFFFETGRLFHRDLLPPIHNIEQACHKQGTPLHHTTTHFTNPTPIVDRQPACRNVGEKGGAENGLPTFSVETICECFEQLCSARQCFDPTPF